MTKLCPRGKAAAKRKFKVYPSAYANAYASKICAGKMAIPVDVNASPREIDALVKSYGIDTRADNFGLPIPKASIIASPDLNTGAFDIGMKKGGRVKKTKFSTKKKKQANKMRKK